MTYTEVFGLSASAQATFITVHGWLDPTHGTSPASTAMEKDIVRAHNIHATSQKADGINGYDFVSWENMKKAINLHCFPLWLAQGSWILEIK